MSNARRLIPLCHISRRRFRGPAGSFQLPRLDGIGSIDASPPLPLADAHLLDNIPPYQTSCRLDRIGHLAAQEDGSGQIRTEL